MTHYISYYENQVGSGGLIEHVYVGSPYQRGHGIGSFLGGLFRRALPMVSSGLRAIGKEALRGSLNIVDDVANRDVNFKESLKRRVGESTTNLQRKAKRKLDDLMEGRGYKNRTVKRLQQSRSVALVKRHTGHKPAKRGKSGKKAQEKQKNKTRNKSAIKKKRSVYDIFE